MANIIAFTSWGNDSTALLQWLIDNRPDDDNIEMNVDEKIHQDLLTYKQDKETRDTLKRSLAKQSMGGQH